MLVEHVADLVCPRGPHGLELAPGAVIEAGEVRDGALTCPSDGARVPIVDFVPRFSPGNRSTATFGAQWNRFRRTQLDKFNGTTLSRDRFHAGTGWRPEDLAGKRVLEVGCGAGRFTQVMLDAGALVYAIDGSTAVDACFTNNGPHPRLLVAQGMLEDPPFRAASFDYVFCYGVLQHTPSPRRALLQLVRFLVPGGAIAVDIYRRRWRPDRWQSKYLWRPFTKRLSSRVLLRLVEWYIPRWLPVDDRLRRIPRLGTLLTGVIPCWNYAGIFPLSETQRREWAVLDTFDALATYHDHPASMNEVTAWCQEAGLAEVRVTPGGNGIQARGRRP